MLQRLKLVALLAVVAGAALVPLYGDPHTAPVTHAEWARMLLRALHMESAVEHTTTAAQAFSILSWRNSLAYRGDRYVSGDGVKVEGQGEARRVLATAAVAEVAYPLAVVRGGDYRLRVRITGNPSTPASAEITRYADTKPLKAFSITPGSVMGWVDVGVMHVDPGAYLATFLLPAGTALEHVEFAPPCVAPIEPPGGWRAAAVLQSEELAVTAVKALDQEGELPPAATPIEVSAEAFQTESFGISQASAAPAQGLQGMWLKAGPGGLRAVVFVELPEAGLYTISVFGISGEGQSWLGDSCRKSVLCGGTEAKTRSDTPAWRVLMTAPFSAGRHFFTVVLGKDAAVERLRAERKKETPADYVATLRRLGFDVGPEGPIARNRAVDAMRFLDGRYVALAPSQCGDIVLPPTPPGQVTGLQVAQIPGPAQPVDGGPPPGLGAPTAPLPGTPAPPTTAPPATFPPGTTTPVTTPPATTPPPTAAAPPDDDADHASPATHPAVPAAAEPGAAEPLPVALSLSPCGPPPPAWGRRRPPGTGPRPLPPAGSGSSSGSSSPSCPPRSSPRPAGSSSPSPASPPGA